HVSAAAPSAAIGPAAGGVLLAAETHATVAPGPTAHVDGHAIDEHGGFTAGRPVALSAAISALGWSGSHRQHVDAPPPPVGRHRALNGREQGPVAADADVLARLPPGAVLPAEDAARPGRLASEKLDSQHLRIRVAAVAARALSLLVSHGSIS